MANQTEMKMIEVIDKFIKYMLTEQDGGTVIYQHLLEQTEENLEDWVNDKFKNWLGNENEYTYTGLVCKECGYDCEDCECEVKETEEEELTFTSMRITTLINTMIHKEVEKQMEGMEFPKPKPIQQVAEGHWRVGRITERGWFLNTQCELQEEETKKFYDNIFSNCRELMDIQKKIVVFTDLPPFIQHSIMETLTCEENILLTYCYMYISQMSATYLKEYIINLFDPVEPK
jgi:hypothetical protein